jgi:putative oligomerization/nucleic acid binding protein
MPGLLRGVARVAVAAGTATAVSNRVSRRQGERWASQDAGDQAPPEEAPPEQAPPPAEGAPDMLTQLRELGELKEQGVLTEDEFADQKARILASQ